MDVFPNPTPQFYCVAAGQMIHRASCRLRAASLFRSLTWRCVRESGTESRHRFMIRGPAAPETLAHEQRLSRVICA